MKIFSIILVFLLANNICYSQINFGVGDDDFNKNLNNINLKAKADFGAFKLELNRTYKAESKKIGYMSSSLKMRPADIFLAFEIAKIKGVSIDIVIGTYKKHKDKGWGYIAKQMGIKPGSPEFHAMKGHAKNKSDKTHGKGAPNKGNNGHGKGNSKKK